MLHRRRFLQSTALGTTLLTGGLGSAIAAVKGRQFNKSVKPIVVSTWNFGIQANEAAWEILQQDGRALDAVEQGVRIPEADPTIQTIGLGGLPDRDGFVTLDACIMDETGNAGSVADIEHIIHAISVARLVMEKTPHVMLVADGALQFALDNGFKKENLLTPASEKAWKKWLKTSKYQPEINIENKTSGNPSAFNPLRLPGNQYNHDTIGMLAIDQQGNLSGACTTSGLAYKMHGRVGDSPIIGAGLFVDNEVGAATSTGVGEEVIKICGTHTVVELMRQGYSPTEACKGAVERIIKKDRKRAEQVQVGFLALNKAGEVGAYCLQKGFNYAVLSKEVPNKLIDSHSYFK